MLSGTGFCLIGLLGLGLGALSTVKPENCPGGSPCAHILSAWAGLGVLCLWAAIPLVAGAWLLIRRDT